MDPVAMAQMQAMREQMEVRAAFQRGITALRDFIAPASLEFQSSLFKIGTRVARTYYVYGYPRQIYTGWISSMVNLDEVIDLSIFIYPVESQVVLDNLRKKVAQLEAGLQIDSEKGKVRDPGKQASIQDAEELRDKLQVGEERFFRFGFYFTIYGRDEEELEFVSHKVESVLAQQLIYSKPASAQQEQGLNSTLPQFTDQLQIRRNMNTGAISTSFPFTSADLTQENGILYGINMHNSGLVIFDRFSLENGNIGLSKDPAHRNVSDSINLTLDYIFGEANRVLLAFEKKYNKTVSKVVLTGGGSVMKGFRDLAQLRLNTKVVTADPFSKTVTPAFLEGVLTDVGPEFAVAVGVALRKLSTVD
jgi:hypothetical protein